MRLPNWDGIISSSLNELCVDSDNEMLRIIMGRINGVDQAWGHKQRNCSSATVGVFRKEMVQSPCGQDEREDNDEAMCRFAATVFDLLGCTPDSYNDYRPRWDGYIAAPGC